MIYRSLFIGAWVALAVLGCSKSTTEFTFPSEAEVRSQIRVGMAREEVIKLFGPPTHEEREGQDKIATLYYLAPFDSASKGKGRGYGGFRVLLKEGKVSEWLPIEGDPPYAPKAP